MKGTCWKNTTCLLDDLSYHQVCATTLVSDRITSRAQVNITRSSSLCLSQLRWKFWCKGRGLPISHEDLESIISRYHPPTCCPARIWSDNTHRHCPHASNFARVVCSCWFTNSSLLKDMLASKFGSYVTKFTIYLKMNLPFLRIRSRRNANQTLRFTSISFLQHILL